MRKFNEYEILIWVRIDPSLLNQLCVIATYGHAFHFKYHLAVLFEKGKSPTIQDWAVSLTLKYNRANSTVKSNLDPSGDTVP